MSLTRRGFLKGLVAAPALAAAPVVVETTEKALGSFNRAQPTALGGFCSPVYNPHLVTRKEIGLDAISWDKICDKPSLFPPDSHAAIALGDNDEQ